MREMTRSRWIERDLQTFEDVGTRFRFPKLELGAPANDLAAEFDEVLEDVEERQHLGPATDDGEHDDAERRLQLRVLVEVVEHHLRHFAALQLDDDSHPIAIRLVAKIRNPFNRFLAHQVGNVFEQPLLVDLIRNLGDDDGDLVPFLDSSVVARARIVMAPRPVVYAWKMPWRPTMMPPVGRSGPGTDFSTAFRRASSTGPLLDDGDRAVDHFPHVVRRDVGRHADRDA